MINVIDKTERTVKTSANILIHDYFIRIAYILTSYFSLLNIIMAFNTSCLFK